MQPKKWITNVNVIDHIVIEIQVKQLYPMIYYHVNNKCHKIMCRLLDSLDDQNMIIYRKSFDHLLEYAHDLYYIRYIMGDDYIPSDL